MQVESIGHRVKIVRDSVKMTQTSFGEKLGIGRDVVSNIELERVPTKDYLIKLISSTFHINEEWLEHGIGEMFRTEDDLYKVLVDSLGTLDDMDRKMIMEYLQLPPSHRKIFKDFMIKITSDKHSEVTATKEDFIDAELESYRLELLAEQKGEILLASEDIKGKVD